MAEERVTTGSEPKRGLDEAAALLARYDRRGPFDALGYNEKQEYRHRARRVVEVVELGHDEQTEEPPREFLLRVIDALVVERDVVRERTVAAVVEALRDASQFSSNSTEAFGYPAAADFIEERFKPSAPGGTDAGG